MTNRSKPSITAPKAPEYGPLKPPIDEPYHVVIISDLTDLHGLFTLNNYQRFILQTASLPRYKRPCPS
ncbi:protein of unknown function [Pseudomonas sp. JV241A]|nr:protein of unknown function [Pseudomonas sp. JV241A]